MINKKNKKRKKKRKKKKEDNDSYIHKTNEKVSDFGQFNHNFMFFPFHSKLIIHLNLKQDLMNDALL
jgi:hypothetical protein